MNEVTMDRMDVDVDVEKDVSAQCFAATIDQTSSPYPTSQNLKHLEKTLKIPIGLRSIHHNPKGLTFQLPELDRKADCFDGVIDNNY
jgi:hypothetical protein